VRVHSVLPERLAAAVEAGRGALEHVAHPAADPMRAAAAAAADADALALIGPFRSHADLVVLCGLAGRPEVARAAARGLPVIAFDGVQDGAPIPDCSLLLPFEPDQDPGGADATARAIGLVVAAWRDGAHDREALRSALRAAGPFDEHGDPVEPPVWLYRAGADWSLQPDRPL
jgi:hypothetical protein